jgi:tetratricopeptide (TPR) repeat protein
MSESAVSTNKPNRAERFKKIIAVLIALVTVLVAITTFLQNDASARDNRANRESKRYAVEAMGRKISGNARVNFDYYSVYQAWSELNLLATSAAARGDQVAANRYQALRDRMIGLSPLLAASYFDPDVGTPNVARYESDVYLVEITALTERFAAASAEKEAWDKKANTYIVHLTLLAVALFLFGLSATVSGRFVRWLFPVVGLAITVFTVGWMVVNFAQPAPALSDKAIEAYARGVGLAYQGEAEKAVAAFDEALAVEPDYANALFERGNANAELGKYEAAAADYEKARAADLDTASVNGNLGWTYYLLGRLDDASKANRRALAARPDELWIRFNQGLNLLAAGQVEAAQAEYATGMDHAAQQVAEARSAGREPSSILWWSLDAGADDLDNLVYVLDSQPRSWSQTPPRPAIARPDAVKPVAQDLVKRLKSLSVALEYTGKPPAGEPKARIGSFQFGQPVYDDQGNVEDYQLAETFPYGTNEVVVLFDYEGLADGQEVMVKVYVDGTEDPSWRMVDQWALGASGSAQKPLSLAYSDTFVFNAGEYMVELYVDYHLAQRGRFVVEEGQ